jgi:hypothetical protein
MGAYPTAGAAVNTDVRVDAMTLLALAGDG